MLSAEQKRFDRLYARHLQALKLQGKSQKTIDAYARAVRQVSQHFDRCPDKLTTPQLQRYFSELVDAHSWSTVKVDRNGLQFFWKHVLKRDWTWLNLVKAPRVQSLPDVLTRTEVEQLIGATRKLRYRVFLLVTYSMGLRLGEALSLQVSDIDRPNGQIHIRRGKGHKDRSVSGTLARWPEPRRPANPRGHPPCLGRRLPAREKQFSETPLTASDLHRDISL